MGKKTWTGKGAAQNAPSEAYFGSDVCEGASGRCHAVVRRRALTLGFHESKVLPNLESGEVEIIKLGGNPDSGELAGEHWCALLRRYQQEMQDLLVGDRSSSPHKENHNEGCQGCSSS